MTKGICENRGVKCLQCRNICEDYVGLKKDEITALTSITIRQSEYATFKIDKSKVKTVYDLLEIMEAFNMTTYTVDISEKGSKKFEVIEKYMERI